jgi:serine protease Do
MFKGFTKVSIAILLLSAAAFSQQPTPTAKPAVRGVVTVVHTVEVQKLLARLRQQHKGAVGVSGSAPQFIFNIATGLALDKEGHIITRLAYVSPQDKDQKISVTTIDGQTVEARVIGVDCPTGFTILEAQSLQIDLPEFAAAQSSDEVRIVSVDFVPAPSTSENPKDFFISPSLKTGRGQIADDGSLSKARGVKTLRSDTLFSRSDGSVVTTTANQIVGMTEYAGVGKSYMFPISLLRDTIAKRVIEKKDSVAAAWLGVVGESLAQVAEMEFGALGLADRRGVIVREVAPDSPASAGGILPNDIIISVDDFDVTGTPDLTAKLLASPAGNTARLKAIRSGKPLEMNVVLGARAFNAPAVDWNDRIWEAQVSGRNEIEARIRDLRSLMLSYNRRSDLSQREVKEAQRELTMEINRLQENLRLADQSRQSLTADFVGVRPSGVQLKSGLIVDDLTAQMASYFGVRGGVLVKSVARGSRAEQSGLRAGDVIVGTEEREPVTVAQLKSAFAYQRKVFSLKVVRQKQPLTILLDNRQ